MPKYKLSGSTLSLPGGGGTYSCPPSITPLLGTYVGQAGARSVWLIPKMQMQLGQRLADVIKTPPGAGGFLPADDVTIVASKHVERRFQRC